MSAHPSSPPPLPVIPAQELRTALRAYRVQSLLSALGEGLSILLAFWGVIAAVAATMGGGLEPSPLANNVTLALAGLAVVSASLHVAVRLLRGPLSIPALARQVDQFLPELKDSVRSAVGLLDFPTEELGASPSLVQAHILSTAAQLFNPVHRRAHARRLWKRSRPHAACGLMGAVLAMGFLLVQPQHLMMGLQRAWERGTQHKDERQAALPPLWSDVTMTLHYPAYMRKDSRTLDGVSGDLSAPKGTEVQLHARADRSVTSARLLFARGDTPLKVTPPRELAGQFTVQEGGRYRLALTDARGEEVVEGDGHTITLEPDHPPVVELLSPTEDRTVALDERLPLSFKARDDFGLTEVNLVIRNLRKGGDPVRRPLATVRGEPVEQTGTATLEIATLEARAGDRLVITVEAKDNDTVSGPKAGLSANRTLKIFSAAEHHGELLAKQEEVLQKMVVQLADELEHPLLIPTDTNNVPPEQEAERWGQQVKRGQSMTEELAALAAEFAKDRLAPLEVSRAMRNMRDDLGRSYDELSVLSAEIKHQARETLRFPEPYAQRSQKLGKIVTDKLRQHILYLEDLMGRQRLTEAQDLAKELAATQARLRDLLAQYAKAGDEATRKRILEEIHSLREQLSQLAAQLARMQRDIPQEYVNTEALNRQDLGQPLDDIDRMLAEGDIEGAAKALEQMAQRTRAMMDQMQESQEEYGGEQYAEMREKLTAFKDELDDITREQERLLNDNKKRMEDVRERARKEMGGDLNQLTARLLAQAEEIKKLLDGISSTGLSDMENEHLEEIRGRADEAIRGLKAKDFEETQRSVRQELSAQEWLRSLLVDRTEGRFAAAGSGARKARERVETVIPKTRKLLEQLERLMPNPADKMTNAERDAVRDSARRQGKLAERARQLGQEMEAIGKEVPLFGPEHKDALEGARRSMQNAQGSLASKDLPTAGERQREALGKMQELQNALQQMGKDGSGQGMPLPFGSSNDGQGRDDGSGGMKNKEKVEIPSADLFKVPAQFRKDILDAMKEPPPNKFQGGVKKYYEELVK